MEELARTYVTPSMFAVLPELYKEYKSQDMYSKYIQYPKAKKIYSSGTTKALSVKRIKELLVQETLLVD